MTGKRHLQEAGTKIEPVVVKFKYGKLVDNKFSAVLSGIFAHKTGDNHQRSDLAKAMGKFQEAHKAFQAEYMEIAKKHANLNEDGTVKYNEQGHLDVSEDKMPEFNKECDALYSRDAEMTFENGRKPFNAMTLNEVSLSAADTTILGDFYTDGFQ